MCPKPSSRGRGAPLSRAPDAASALSAPAATFFPTLRAFAAPHQGKVKITGIRAMALQNIAGNCLIRVDTDAGLTGYGEAGSSGPMARARIDTMKHVLIGKDPLAIEVLFHEMTTEEQECVAASLIEVVSA